jgi:phospholipid/cholesterol/gamma-HCH transport system ATP-binding protein
VHIELKNVAVDLGGKNILKDICLKFEPGQATLVQGNSGSGLSVLLKTIAGLIQPSKGQILYDGIDIASMDEGTTRQAHIRTGFMFQDAALWANMNLAANLDLPLQAKYPDVNSPSRKQIIDEALKQFGFTVDLNMRPVQLSLGGQKIMSFLRATIPGPEVLLLDEPLAGMDQNWADKVILRLAELRANGTTIIFGSHNLQISSDMADHLVVLNKGQIVKNDQEVPRQ